MTRRLELAAQGDDVAKEAFRLLLETGQPVGLDALAARLDVDAEAVRRSLKDVERAGRAELEGDTLFGIFGLSLKRTQHRLEMRGARYFTWCAYDIVGIAAALGESAEGATPCGFCGRKIRLTIKDGIVQPAPTVISWLSERCDSVKEQFCPNVNAYCDAAHYQAACQRGDAPDGAISLEQAAELGIESWGWAK